MSDFYHRCIECGKKYRKDDYYRECDCGGLLEVIYEDLDGFPDNAFSGVWRFHDLLPLKDTYNAVDLGVKESPLIKADLFGLRDLWIKVEAVQPTKTFKDREAFMNLSRLRELGYSELVTATTGDSGLAHAYGCSRTKAMKLTVFLPENAVPRWESMVADVGGLDSGYVNTITSGETFDQAIAASKEYAKNNNLPLEYGFYNSLRIEGMKTIGFEVNEKIGEVDAYVQSCASGVGVYAFHKAYRDLGKEIPRLYAIQPGGCAPMVNAWNGKENPEVENMDTLALGIAQPKLYVSYPHLERIMKRYGGGFEAVFTGSREEAENYPGLGRLYESVGIRDSGLEARIALAGLEKLVNKGKIEKDEKVVLNCSGGMRKDLN